jgi:pimeloyl-ACP methyl ester carboxylesterase
MAVLSLQTLEDTFTNDAELRYKLKGFSGRFRVTVDDLSIDLILADGSITAVQPADGRSADLAVVAPGDVLDESARSKPVPGTESLQLAAARGVAVIGDMNAVVAPYAGAAARAYQLLRRMVGVLENGIPNNQADLLFQDTDTAVGRYVYVTVQGVKYRVYYEEAGAGENVLLLQHTAGADARQWRNQLADPEFQSRCRLIAYDLPFHGRSLPPVSQRWWEQPYLPSRGWFMGFVAAFADALALVRPSFMGCSVGGQLALDLAAYRGERFGAFFALNGTLNNARAHDPVLAKFNDLCRDNRVSTEFYATGNFGATSPLAPEPYRREIYWIYRSNFPGIYAGDNDYFLTGHDLTKDDPRIDTGRNPVYLLAGEYDPVATDPHHGGPAVAEAFPGVVYKELKDLSHFAPTDDPLAFREAILPLVCEGFDALAQSR